jgi:hypothetical protein
MFISDFRLYHRPIFFWEIELAFLNVHSFITDISQGFRYTDETDERILEMWDEFEGSPARLAAHVFPGMKGNTRSMSNHVNQASFKRKLSDRGYIIYWMFHFYLILMILFFRMQSRAVIKAGGFANELVQRANDNQQAQALRAQPVGQVQQPQQAPQAAPPVPPHQLPQGVPQAPMAPAPAAAPAAAVQVQPAGQIIPVALAVQQPRGADQGQNKGIEVPYGITIQGTALAISTRVTSVQFEAEPKVTKVRFYSNGPTSDQTFAIVTHLLGAQVAENLTRAEKDMIMSLARETRTTEITLEVELQEGDVINHFGVEMHEIDGMYVGEQPTGKKKKVR